MILFWIKLKNKFLIKIVRIKQLDVNIKKWAYRRKLTNDYIIALIEYHQKSQEKMPVEEIQPLMTTVMARRGALNYPEIQRGIKKYEKLRRRFL